MQIRFDPHDLNVEAIRETRVEIGVSQQFKWANLKNGKVATTGEFAESWLLSRTTSANFC